MGRISFLWRGGGEPPEKSQRPQRRDAEAQRRGENQRKAEEEKEKPGGLGNLPPGFFLRRKQFSW
jgi:hypothetical protein